MGQIGSILARVFVFLKSDCIRVKRLHLGKSGCIRVKLLYFGKSGCNRAKCL